MTTVQSNTQLFRDNIQAFNDGDIERFASFIADDGVYHQFGTNDTFHGREEFKAAVAGWKSAFPDMQGEILAIIESGDKVAATVRWRGTHTEDMVGAEGTIPATGKPVDVQSSFMNTVKDGKFIDSQNHFDMLTMLQQLGVA